MGSTKLNSKLGHLVVILSKDLFWSYWQMGCIIEVYWLRWDSTFTSFPTALPYLLEDFDWCYHSHTWLRRVNIFSFLVWEDLFFCILGYFDTKHLLFQLTRLFQLLFQKHRNRFSHFVFASMFLNLWRLFFA